MILKSNLIRMAVLLPFGLISVSYVVEARSAQPRIPLPVQKFEAYCYRTGADHDRATAWAKATHLKRIPKEMEKAAGPLSGGGEVYVIKVDRKNGRTMFLGVSDKDTCSVAALGYDTKAIIESIRSNYDLKLLDSNKVGLQVNELYVPGGGSNPVEKIPELGIVGIMYAKDNSGVTLSYISPSTARRLFSHGKEK